MSFAQRLKSLIGEESVSGFARRVDISEALLRKYLKGSEPSLAKANQIAMKANCSLEWLATGCGYLYRQAEVVDKPALYAAYEHINNKKISPDEAENLLKTVSGYQFLRTHKKADKLPALYVYIINVSGFYAAAAAALNFARVPNTSVRLKAMANEIAIPTT